ncbi:MAG: hypothetical protein HY077_14405 [Elusimicrobia bacterium]|nr:hypothetical protein [Elusimicrobiota bacterium]
MLLTLSGSVACAAPSAPAKTGAGIKLTDEQALEIGRMIFQNEAGGKVQFLTHWNDGEDFASLGIGHFIWYHEGAPGPFTESFPPLVAFLESAGVPLPDWLKRPCPWKSKDAFFKDFHSQRMDWLRKMLEGTIPQQARFAAKRLEDALPKILVGLPKAEQDKIRRRFYDIAADANGVYALVDYVNFKGEGISPTERYHDQGWGLLQALSEMQDAPEGKPSAESFAAGADLVLTRRVKNSPPERHEEKWLPGWRKRLKTYAP